MYFLNIIMLMLMELKDIVQMCLKKAIIKFSGLIYARGTHQHNNM